MDDDDLAALLRSQSASTSAYPAWGAEPSPTLDPFANPFANEPSSGAIGGGFGASAGGGGGFGEAAVSGFGDMSAMPSADERRDATEANNRIDEVYVARVAGGGVADVSPYVAKIQEDAEVHQPYGSTGADMERQASSSTITAPPASSDLSGFGAASGFDLDTPYVPPPPAAPFTATVGPGDSPNRPFDGGRADEMYAGPPINPLPSSLYASADPYNPEMSPKPFGTVPTSAPPPLVPATSRTAFFQADEPPVAPRHTTRVLPSSLLGPDMLGTTPEESLKAAFKKSSKDRSKANGSDAASSGKAQEKKQAAGGKPASAPYVFKPGGNAKGKKPAVAIKSNGQASVPAKDLAPQAPSAKPIEDSGRKSDASPPQASAANGAGAGEPAQADEPASVERESAISEQAAEASKPAAEAVPVAGEATKPIEPANASRSGAAPGMTDEANPTPETDKIANGFAPPQPASDPPQAVRPTVAEEILTAEDPKAASLDVATNIAEAVPSATTQHEDSAVDGLVKDLSALPALPASGPATPRPRSPAIASTQPAAQPQTAQPPHSSLPQSPPSARFDKVLVSPLDQPKAEPYTRGFSAFSLGGSAPLNSESPGSHASWGRSFDEPGPSNGNGWGGNADEVSGGWQADSRTNGWDDRRDSVSAESSAQATSSPTQPSSTLPAEAASSPSRKRLLNQPMFTIILSDPTKVGDPIRGHVVYTVTTRTTSPHYRRAEFSVLRRFSDFLWLYEAVSNNNPGVVVPPVPDKHPFGRFEDQFIETRRAALQRCLGKMANHPVLGLDPDLRTFLESDSFALDIKHRKSEVAQDRQGLLSSLGGTLVGAKFSEQDDWFNSKKTFLDVLESQVKGLIKAVETQSKQRLDLSIAVAELADAITLLSESDLSQELTQVLGQLADLINQEKDLTETQAKMDVVHLLNTGDEYIRTIASVRLAFASRIKSYHTWQATESDTRKLKANHEKLRKQGKIAHDRIQPALAEIADAERKCIDTHSNFDAVTRLVKIEFARFDAERVEDFKTMLEKYLEGMIGRQKELIKAWEDFHGVCAKLAQK